MLTELCQFLKNWFEVNQVEGTITISGGTISVAPDGLMRTAPEPQQGQYIRIVGSIWNDGVVLYGSDELRDETFEGSVWLMAIPKAVLALAQDISDWREKYESLDNPSMSPYNSESFGGYSYSKGGITATAGSGQGLSGWQGAFYNRLTPWRKI